MESPKGFLKYNSCMLSVFFNTGSTDNPVSITNSLAGAVSLFSEAWQANSKVTIDKKKPAFMF